MMIFFFGFQISWIIIIIIIHVLKLYDLHKFLKWDPTLENRNTPTCHIASPCRTQEGVGANQPVHWFLGGKGLGIQQGMSVWVVLSKSQEEEQM